MKFKTFLIISTGFATAVSADTKYFYNHVGYDASQPISIIVQSDTDLENAEWSLWMTTDSQMTGQSVKQGKIGKGVNPDNWLNNGKFYRIDLGQTLSPGIYNIEVAGASPSGSGSFTVAENALAKNTLGTVLDYFYMDRAYETDAFDIVIPVYGNGQIKDVHGGWYDASGDVSKYFSHLSYANYLNPQQIPMTAWALAFTSERIPNLLSSISATESNIDEAVYGADFLVRMQDEAGFFYMTVFDNWGAGKRELCAFTGSDGKKSSDYQTAFREGGGMAIAALARIAKLNKKGSFTSQQYLDAAKKGFEHLQGKQTIGGSCEYCDDHKENIIDDYTALLAATELYATTNEAEYLTEARKRAQSLQGRISKEGYFWSDDDKTRPFWHASDAGLPLIALCRYAEVESDNTNLISTGAVIKTHLDWLIKVTNETGNPFGYARQTYKTTGSIKNGFFIPHDNESNYWWQGENARIASLAAATIYASRILGMEDTESIKKYATDQMDWILGKNPYDVCMMKGKGRNNPAIYDGQSPYDATLDGGIANGITGKNQDGSGIAWDSDGVGAVGFDPQKEAWNNWRWIEQWLPHSTWYLMALTSRYDEVSKAIAPMGIKQKATVAENFKISLVDRTLTLNLNRTPAQKNAEIHVASLNGSVIASHKITGKQTTFELPQHAKGIYLVQVPGIGTKKIIAH